MASTLQHFPQQSLILWLTLLATWLHLTAALTVQLKYTRPTVKRDSMPDGLDVTLTGETGTSSDVQLRLLQHSVPDVPVYTLEVDESGQYVKHLEELEVNPNVAYYQDLNNDAIMQVTRTAGRGDREAHYELQGDLNIEGQKYSLNPNERFQRESLFPSETESYTLVPQELPRFARHDHLTAPSQDELQVVEAAQTISPDLGHILAGDNGQRRQVGGVQPIIIDVAAVVDYIAYSRFLATSKSKNEALQAIRLYYAFIFSGVDLRYKGIRNPQYPITVRLIKLIISETAATSQFTLQFKVPNLNQTDTYKALDAFKLFSQGSSSVLKPNDHAMLFSGYDLATVHTNGTVTNELGGLAFVSTLCRNDGSSTSIVEDLGPIQIVIGISAHELGHSFSASHDQAGNTCKEDDCFIMSPGGRPVTPTNKYNPWLFSNCSINYFMNYTTQTLKTSAGAACLLRQLNASGVTDVSNRLPGQEYSVDQQCRMILGNSSYMCRGEPASDVCTRLLCSKPNENLCYVYSAAMGTSCGNKKMCIGGKCVSDPRAPAVDDNCVFGDPPGVAFNGQTCSQFVNGYSGYCYQSVVKDSCCGSCKAAYRNVAGCEYGDNLTGCVSGSCPYYSASDRSKCCHTCPSGASSIPTGPRSPVNREVLISSPAPPLVQPAVQP
jgi:hypothetical protein